MLLASRDIIGSNKWVDNNTDNENISKDMEKAKKNFAEMKLKAKTWRNRSWELSED